MSFILLAFVLIVIAEIFLFKFYSDGGKQLVKYDKEHSNIQSANTEEFASTIKAIPKLEISQIECNSNEINLVCHKNKYTIIVENGIVSVEYDKTGFEIKLSTLGKILKIFKFNNSVKKATVINSVMDCIAGKDSLESEKEYKKVKNDRTVLSISFLAMIVCLIIGICNITGNIYGDAIAKVKAINFFDGITYEELINGYLENPNWTAFNSDNDVAVIEVNGISINDEEILIQFTGELGMGFNSVDTQDFHLSYFEADGESLNPYDALEYIYEYLTN